MKDLLVKVLIEGANTSFKPLGKLNAVKKYITLFKTLELNNEVVALITTSKRVQEIFQIACLLQGINYIIINENNYDEFLLVNLAVKIVMYNSSEIDFIPSELFDVTSVVIVIDALTCKIVRTTEEYRFVYNAVDETLAKTVESNESIESFKQRYVKIYNQSRVYVKHPGVSTLGSKISIFYSEAFKLGALNVIEKLYYEIKSKNLLSGNQQINMYCLESPAYPHVFLNSVFLALFTKGQVNYSECPFNVLFTSVSSLSILFNRIVEDSYILSLLPHTNILFKYIFKYIINTRFKHLKLIILYGKTDKRVRQLINYTGKHIIYLYSMTEVASFVSFEYYKKLPVNKIPTVGILNSNVVLNSGSKAEAEVLIDTEDRFASYTNTEFTKICSTSEKYAGMHGTLDIAKNVEGKLQVLGKADEIYYNEHGLRLQSDLINSIALDSRYIKDVLITASKGKLVLLVEIKISVLLSEEKTVDQIQLLLNTDLLYKINKKVQNYSHISRIIIIPGGFTREIDGKIKCINYL